jgi:hypothetical protein
MIYETGMQSTQFHSEEDFEIVLGPPDHINYVSAKLSLLFLVERVALSDISGMIFQ